MRPHTPTLNISQAGPSTSPQDTPTTGSPKINRRLASNGQPLFSKLNQQFHHMPLGSVGLQFPRYSRGARPEEISPRSSSSSGDKLNGSASPPQSPFSDIPEIRPSVLSPPPVMHARKVTTTTTLTSFSIEEIHNDDDEMDDSDCDHLGILHPSGFEYPESDRSRSRSRPPREVDPGLMTGLMDLNCFASDESDLDFNNDDDDGDDEVMRVIRQQREMKKQRRGTAGSLSKRTVSERDSDSDREDLKPWDNGEAGPNPRRLRRKTDRHSLLSIPPEVIVELQEPNSDGESNYDESELLARELPYYTFMEVDSE